MLVENSCHGFNFRAPHYSNWIILRLRIVTVNHYLITNLCYLIFGLKIDFFGLLHHHFLCFTQLSHNSQQPKPNSYLSKASQEVIMGQFFLPVAFQDGVDVPNLVELLPAASTNVQGHWRINATLSKVVDDLDGLVTVSRPRWLQERLRQV